MTPFRQCLLNRYGEKVKVSGRIVARGSNRAKVCLKDVMIWGIKYDIHHIRVQKPKGVTKIGERVVFFGVVTGYMNRKGCMNIGIELIS